MDSPIVQYMSICVTSCQTNVFFGFKFGKTQIGEEDGGERGGKRKRERGEKEGEGIERGRSER